MSLLSGLLCLILYLLCVFGDFFFFKQKTAYEMRISDWSSDVCSSDLCEPVGARIGFADGVTTRASPLRQVAASRHLFRAPGSREGNAPRQQQADCNGFLPHAGSP